MNMIFIDKISREKGYINLICLFFSIVHFIAVFYFSKNFTLYDEYSNLELCQKLFLVSVKFISFLLIILFWQLISTAIKLYINDNREIKLFSGYFFVYFAINLLIICLIHPLQFAEGSTINTLNLMKTLSIEWHPNWFQSLYTAVFYNIIPSFFGISLCLNFIYSLLFSYTILNAKKYISDKYYFLMFIPFVLPPVLALNQVPYRSFVLPNLLLFVFLFIYFNTKKERVSIHLAVFYGIICAIAAYLRLEYFLLLFFVVICCLIFKVFSKKILFIFTLVMFSCFLLLNFISHKGHDAGYEMHNLSFIYMEYLMNKDKYINTELDKNLNLLEGVYQCDYDSNNNLNCGNESLDLINKRDKMYVITILVKFAIRHSFFFINNHIKDINYTDNSFALVTQGRLGPEGAMYNVFGYEFNENMPQYNILNSLLYLSSQNKVHYGFAFFYNPIISLVILLFLFLYGLFSSKKFYMSLTFLWVPILYITVLFGFCSMYEYYWIFVINMWFMLFLCLTEIMEKIFKRT